MAGGNLDVEIPSVPSDLVPLADALSVLKRQMRARLTALEAEQKTLRTALNGLSDAVFLLEGDIDPLCEQRRWSDLQDADARLAGRLAVRRRAP